MIPNPAALNSGTLSTPLAVGIGTQIPTAHVGRARSLNGIDSSERGNNCLREALKQDDKHKPFHTGLQRNTQDKEYARMYDSQSHNYSAVEHCQHHLLLGAGVTKCVSTQRYACMQVDIGTTTGNAGFNQLMFYVPFISTKRRKRGRGTMSVPSIGYIFEWVWVIRHLNFLFQRHANVDGRVVERGWPHFQGQRCSHQPGGHGQGMCGSHGARVRLVPPLPTAIQ